MVKIWNNLPSSTDYLSRFKNISCTTILLIFVQLLFNIVCALSLLLMLTLTLKNINRAVLCLRCQLASLFLYFHSFTFVLFIFHCLYFSSCVDFYCCVTVLYWTDCCFFISCIDFMIPRGGTKWPCKYGPATDFY